MWTEAKAKSFPGLISPSHMLPEPQSHNSYHSCLNTLNQMAHFAQCDILSCCMKGSSFVSTNHPKRAVNTLLRNTPSPILYITLFVFQLAKLTSVTRALQSIVGAVSDWEPAGGITYPSWPWKHLAGSPPRGSWRTWLELLCSVCCPRNSELDELTLGRWIDCQVTRMNCFFFCGHVRGYMMFLTDTFLCMFWQICHSVTPLMFAGHVMDMC